MSYTVPEGVLFSVMNPMGSFDDRKAALLVLVAEAWQQGWRDCAEIIADFIEKAPEGLIETSLSTLVDLLRKEAQ